MYILKDVYLKTYILYILKDTYIIRVLQTYETLSMLRHDHFWQRWELAKSCSLISEIALNFASELSTWKFQLNFQLAFTFNFKDKYRSFGDSSIIFCSLPVDGYCLPSHCLKYFEARCEQNRIIIRLYNSSSRKYNSSSSYIRGYIFW